MCFGRPVLRKFLRAIVISIKVIIIIIITITIITVAIIINMTYGMSSYVRTRG